MKTHRTKIAPNFEITTVAIKRENQGKFGDYKVAIAVLGIGALVLLMQAYLYQRYGIIGEF